MSRNKTSKQLRALGLLLILITIMAATFTQAQAATPTTQKKLHTISTFASITYLIPNKVPVVTVHNSDHFDKVGS